MCCLWSQALCVLQMTAEQGSTAALQAGQAALIQSLHADILDLRGQLQKQAEHNQQVEGALSASQQASAAQSCAMAGLTLPI